MIIQTYILVLVPLQNVSCENRSCGFIYTHNDSIHCGSSKELDITVENSGSGVSCEVKMYTESLGSNPLWSVHSLFAGIKVKKNVQFEQKTIFCSN